MDLEGEPIEHAVLMKRVSALDRYRHLADLVGMLVDAGQAVVVDATFLDQRMRTLMRDTAKQRQVPFAIAHATAPFKGLENRVFEFKTVARPVAEG